MKIFKILGALALFLFLVSPDADAQCKTFAKTKCLSELGDYTHDGNYHATVLVEGEEAELYKTFYSDMEYRVSVCGDEKLPRVEFKVLDASSNVLFSSKEANNVSVWDFKLESSQQLKFIIKVGNSNQQGGTPASGCVAIMFGFKIKKQDTVIK